MITASDSIALDLTVPDSVKVGEPVRFTLRIRNLKPTALDLYLRGREPTFDLIVARRASAQAWRRLDGEMVPAIVNIRTLAPGDQFELVAEWNQQTKEGARVPSGEYAARALLLGEGEPLAAPIKSFRIVER